MRDIDDIALGGTGTEDNMRDIMRDSIKQIEVLVPLPVFPVSRSRLSRPHILLWPITIGTSVAVMDFLVY